MSVTQVDFPQNRCRLHKLSFWDRRTDRPTQPSFRDTRTDRPMSATQVEFPGLRQFPGHTELGCSRWSFTRIGRAQHDHGARRSVWRAACSVRCPARWELGARCSVWRAACGVQCDLISSYLVLSHLTVACAHEGSRVFSPYLISCYVMLSYVMLCYLILLRIARRARRLTRPAA